MSDGENCSTQLCNYSKINSSTLGLGLRTENKVVNKPQASSVYWSRKNYPDRLSSPPTAFFFFFTVSVIFDAAAHTMALI